MADGHKVTWRLTLEAVVSESGGPPETCRVELGGRWSPDWGANPCLYNIALDMGLLLRSLAALGRIPRGGDECESGPAGMFQTGYSDEELT